MIIDGATRPEGGSVIFSIYRRRRSTRSTLCPRGRPSRGGSEPIPPPLLTELLAINNPKLIAAVTYIEDILGNGKANILG